MALLHELLLIWTGGGWPAGLNEKKANYAEVGAGAELSVAKSNIG